MIKGEGILSVRNRNQAKIEKIKFETRKKRKGRMKEKRGKESERKEKTTG